MNRCPLNLTLSKSIDGFLNYKLAEGLTQRSISSYEWVLRKWVEQRGDHLLTEVVQPLSTVDNSVAQKRNV
jgi:integrase/recombinase XerD